MDKLKRLLVALIGSAVPASHEMLAQDGPFRRLAHDLRAAEQRPAPPRPATRARVRS